MEIRNRQQNLGFGTVNAKFPIEQFKGGQKLLKRFVEKMEETGDTVVPFPLKNVNALKIDSTPQREELILNLLKDLGIISAKHTDNPLKGQACFIRHKAKIIYDMDYVGKIKILRAKAKKIITDITKN